ncbi:MAG: hypothetical protein ABJB47_06365 [Actinomycetota bacterium]
MVYVESNPAILSYDCLLRLAGALDTILDALLGADAPDSTSDLAPRRRSLPPVNRSIPRTRSTP